MIREIGSEFWINKNEIEETNNGTPLWLNKFGNIVLTSSGRGAISLVLNQIRPKIRRVLLPSYICDSVIIPFEKAGYELIYYDLDEHLIPQIKDVEGIEIGVFLHMGYYGFPTNKNLVDIITRLKSKAVVIIEDVTHTLFSSYPRIVGNDFIVGSIRKWFGIPSGGFLAYSSSIKTELEEHPGMFIELRTNGLLKKYEYIKSRNNCGKNDYLKDFRDAEESLDEYTQFYKIDAFSQKRIENFDSNHLNNRRIENYRFLLKQLISVDGIEVIFSNLENNIIPIFFPIYLKQNRDRLRDTLIEKEIYCPVHWSIPKQLNGRLNSTTKFIYDSILSIPCDQRYQFEDMQRIVNEIRSFAEEE